MFEKAAEVFELGHRDDEFLEVFQAAGGIGRALGLPHPGIARFVEHDLHQIGVRNPPGLVAPAVERRDKPGERIAAGRSQPVAGDQQPRRLDQWQPPVPGQAVELLQGGAADAAARRVQDALEGEVVGRLVDQPQIGERVADLLALVKARAADHPIGQGERDEPFLELAGLKAGADQDRDLAERVALALQRLDLVADPARLLLGVP